MHSQATAIVNDKERIRREKAKDLERQAKERMRLLKMNDEDGYRKMLDGEKDGRLKELLDQTDTYMKTMQAKIEDHQQVEKQAEQQKRRESQQLEGGGMASDDAAAKLEQAKKERRRSTGNRSKFGEAHSVGEQVIQPTMLGGPEKMKLKEYQVEGLEWMVSLYNNRLNGILADEMGLGKTIQSLALLTYLIQYKNNMGPFLVIVPLTVMSNWIIELEKWCPTVQFVPYKGNPTLRKSFHSQIKAGEFNVLLTTYDFVIKDKAVLSKVEWQYMIIDEGHRLKNKDGKLTKILSKYYKAPRRLLLSGTPLQNSLPELWALLNFLLPDIFKSAETFDEWFAKPFSATGERMELSEEESMLIIRRLHKALQPFLLRRLKSDVRNSLHMWDGALLVARLAGCYLVFLLASFCVFPRCALYQILQAQRAGTVFACRLALLTR